LPYSWLAYHLSLNLRAYCQHFIHLSRTKSVSVSENSSLWEHKIYVLALKVINGYFDYKNCLASKKAKTNHFEKFKKKLHFVSKKNNN